MTESLRLKFFMIRNILLGSATFCFSNVLHFAFANMLGDQFVRVKLILTLQSFDFIWIAFILWGCRPRKEWPAFFSLSINEFMPGQRAGSNQREIVLPPSLSTAPIIDTLISEDLLEMDNKCDSVGPNDGVIVINPTKYTIQFDDFDYEYGTNEGQERSAFDPDQIVDEA